jgi:hypothetical protein
MSERFHSCYKSVNFYFRTIDTKPSIKNIDESGSEHPFMCLDYYRIFTLKPIHMNVHSCIKLILFQSCTIP